MSATDLVVPDAPDTGAKAQTFDARRTERLDAIPALYKLAHERLAFELALRIDDPEAVFARHGFNADQAAALMETPAFTALLARVAQEVAENGVSYRVKARAIAEELLPEAFDIATDPLQPTAERVKLIQWAAKVGGLEPKESKDGEGKSGGFSLNITFTGEAPRIEKVIDHA